MLYQPPPADSALLFSVYVVRGPYSFEHPLPVPYEIDFHVGSITRCWEPTILEWKLFWASETQADARVSMRTDHCVSHTTFYQHAPTALVCLRLLINSLKIQILDFFAGPGSLAEKLQAGGNARVLREAVYRYPLPQLFPPVLLYQVLEDHLERLPIEGIVWVLIHGCSIYSSGSATMPSGAGL